jgi:hypothetical protein
MHGHEGSSLGERILTAAIWAAGIFLALCVLGWAIHGNDPFERSAEWAAKKIGWNLELTGTKKAENKDCVVGDKTYDTIRADSEDCTSLHDLATKAAGTSGGSSDAPTQTPAPAQTSVPGETPTVAPTPASQDDLVAQHAKDPWSFGNHCWIDERVLPLGVGSNRIYVPDDTNALLKTQGGTCYVAFGTEIPFTFNSSQGQVYVDEKLVRSDNGVVTKGTKFRVVYGADNGANGFDITY